MSHFTRLASISLLLWMCDINEGTNVFFFSGNCSEISRWKATHAPNLIIFLVHIWNSWKQNQRLKSMFSMFSATCRHIPKSLSGSWNSFSYFWDWKETKQIAILGLRFRQSSRNVFHTSLDAHFSSIYFRLPISFSFYIILHIVYSFLRGYFCSWI